jgi:hypothetical protein
MVAPALTVVPPIAPFTVIVGEAVIVTARFCVTLASHAAVGSRAEIIKTMPADKIRHMIISSLDKLPFRIASRHELAAEQLHLRSPAAER